MNEEPQAAETPEPATARLPAPPRRAASEAGQLLLWTVRFAIVVALALVLAFGGFMLGTFGLAGVALGGAVVLVAGAALLWRRAMLPAAVLATALALSASVTALSSVRFDRTFGTLVVAPANPKEVARTTYRRGAGPILIDLRGFRGYTGGATRISARADYGRVVVALPTDRCFSLNVRYATTQPYGGGLIRETALTGLTLLRIQNGSEIGMGFGSMGLSEAAMNREQEANQNLSEAAQQSIYGISAYGRSATEPGAFVRKGPTNAPRIDLTIVSTAQIVIRDYPAFVGPLNDGYSTVGGNEQVAGMSWPQTLQAPRSPGQLKLADAATVRTRANRARWVAWERRVIAWAKEQARRYAGHCATRDQLRDRAVQFTTQPERVRDENGHAVTLLGGPTTRHSSIEQPPMTSASRVLRVEVNGLGEIRYLGSAGGTDLEVGANS